MTSSFVTRASHRVARLAGWGTPEINAACREEFRIPAGPSVVSMPI
jgi:hypothetical protein